MKKIGKYTDVNAQGASTDDPEVRGGRF